MTKQHLPMPTNREEPIDLEARVAELEAALQNRENQLNQWAKHQLAGLWCWNETHQTVWLSRAWQTLLGYPAEDTSLSAQIWADSFHPDDWVILQQIVQNHFKENAQAPAELQLRAWHRNGQIRWLLMRFKPPEGQKLWGQAVDITTIKQAEFESDQSAANLQAILNYSTQAFILLDEKATICSLNQVAKKRSAKIFGEAMALDRSMYDFLLPSDRENFELNFQAALAGQTRIIEAMVNNENNAPYWYEVTYNPVYNPQGQVKHVSIASTDITERKKSEELMRLLQAAVKGSIDGISISDARHPEQPLVFVNPGFEKMTGYSSQEVIGFNCRFLQNDDRDQPARAKLRQAIEKGEECRVVLRNYHKNGTLFWNELTVYPIYNQKNELTHFVGIQHDITHRKQTEEKLRESQAFLQATLDALSAHIAILDEQGQILEVNKAWREFAQKNGFSRQSYGVGESYLEAGDIDSGPNAEDGSKAVQGIQQVMSRELAEFDHEYPCHSPSERRWFVMRATRFTSGDSVRVVIAHENVTKLKLVQEALRHSEERYRRRVLELQTLHEISLQLKTHLEPSAMLQLISEQARNLLHAKGFGFCTCQAEHDALLCEFAVGNLQNIQGQTFSLTNTVLGKILEKSLIQAKISPPTWPIEGSLLAIMFNRDKKKPGVLFVARSAGQPVFNEYDAQLLELFSAQAEIALENVRLYEQEKQQYQRLEQSQALIVQMEKMAALGRLVASIAHEINNPLQSVQSCLTLVQEMLEYNADQGRMHMYLRIADEEIERIAAIVHRMRNFYRSPRTTDTKPSDTVEAFYWSVSQDVREVNIPALLENVLQLTNKQLSRHLIDIKLDLQANVPPVMANPDYLKQVFLNLILNAIDAMEVDAGKLRISSSVTQIEISDGDWVPAVKIVFADTGPGIEEAHLPRIFEPMFTTKAQGSGFGLFTSYKIIEAHQGDIQIDSELGQGTTVSIILPQKLQLAE